LLPELGLALVQEGLPADFASGQCFLVRRDHYEAAGGHGHPAVRGSVVDDRNLARALTGHDARIAPKLLRARMYRDRQELWAGLVKNQAALHGRPAVHVAALLAPVATGRPWAAVAISAGGRAAAGQNPLYGVLAPVARLGYNLFDTGPDPQTIAGLPAGGQALVWLGSLDNADCAAPSYSVDRFRAAVDRLVVLGAGKASAEAAQALEQMLGPRLSGGVVVVPRPAGVAARRVTLMEADHPIPGQASADGARALLKQAEGLGKRDLAICVFTGGSSALASLPLARLMGRFGRRPGLVLGYALAILGSGLAMAGVLARSFPLLLLGMAVVCLLLSEAVWRVSVRHYTSASS